MGHGFTLTCRECLYTKEFLIGIGMMYSPHNLTDFDSELALLPGLIRSKKVLAHIKQLLEEGAEIADDYGHRVYHCQKCNELHSRFYIKLNYQGGSYQVEYKCSKCKRPLSLVTGGKEEGFDLDLGRYSCPECGTYSLEEGLFTMWD